MSVIPSRNVEQLEFFESHWPVWVANAAGIGVLPASANSFKTLTQSARAAYDSALTARNNAKAATTTQDAALAQARTSAADLIRVIKGYAEQQANPDAVYALAQIPPPAAPTPVPAPGQPRDITVGLEPNGAITLRWKAVNAAPNAGTFFSITRKLPGESTFVLVGNTGGKIFTDDTITQGTTGATYIIQGHRGQLDGPMSDQVGVQFGVGGGGGFVLTNAKDASKVEAA